MLTEIEEYRKQGLIKDGWWLVSFISIYPNGRENVDIAKAKIDEWGIRHSNEKDFTGRSIPINNNVWLLAHKKNGNELTLWRYTPGEKEIIVQGKVDGANTVNANGWTPAPTFYIISDDNWEYSLHTDIWHASKNPKEIFTRIDKESIAQKEIKKLKDCIPNFGGCFGCSIDKKQTELDVQYAKAYINNLLKESAIDLHHFVAEIESSHNDTLRGSLKVNENNIDILEHCCGANEIIETIYRYSEHFLGK